MEIMRENKKTKEYEGSDAYSSVKANLNKHLSF